MLVEHLNKKPRIDESAYVAPNATVCGDVPLGAGASVFHSATIGTRSGVRINAVLQGRHGGRSSSS